MPAPGREAEGLLRARGSPSVWGGCGSLAGPHAGRGSSSSRLALASPAFRPKCGTLSLTFLSARLSPAKTLLQACLRKDGCNCTARRKQGWAWAQCGPFPRGDAASLLPPEIVDKGSSWAEGRVVPLLLASPEPPAATAPGLGMVRALCVPPKACDHALCTGLRGEPPPCRSACPPPPALLKAADLQPTLAFHRTL